MKPATPAQEHSFLTMLSKNSVIQGAAYTSLMSLMGSAAAAASKLLDGKASAEQIVFFQYLICLLCVSHLLPSPEKLRIAPGDRITVVIRGLSGLLGFYALYVAIREISLIEAVLLRNTAPFFVPILAALWLHSKTPAHNIIAIAIGFVGVYLVLDPGLNSPGPGHFTGLLSGFFLAISMVSTRKLATRYAPTTILFYYYLVSLIGIAPFCLSQPLTLQAGDWLILLFIGLSAHLALYLYTRALTVTKASIVAPLSYLSVIFAGIIGWLLWDQKPSTTSLAGMAIVILAGVTTTALSSRAPHARA